MKAYKCFDENLRCQGFQYAVGGTYKAEGKLVMCKNGFHSCPNPLDCLAYYPATSRWCIVEAGGEILRGDDGMKICSSEITIVQELDLAGLFLEVRKHCRENNVPGMDERDGEDAASPASSRTYVSSLKDQGIALGGTLTLAETKGGGLSAVKTGMARSGDDGTAVVTEEGLAVTGGWGTSYAWSGKAVSGFRGFSLARGCMGEAYSEKAGLSMAERIAVTGDEGVTVTGGKGETGADGVVVARGARPFAKGGLGAVLVFQNPYSWSPDYKMRVRRAIAVIDGKEYLPDTWYTLDVGDDGEYCVRRALKDEV